ncbi:MBG domain-containing protein [Candidatus Omnitrophota bacterium]
MKKMLFSILLLVLTLAIAAPASAAVWTDQEDYAPGSVVTISGDNSDGAGYLAGEEVVVEVSGPNSYEASFTAVVEEDGSWSGTVTLPDDESAVGDYEYTATGLTSGVTQSSMFTDAINPDTVSVGGQTGTLTAGVAGSATYGITSTWGGGGSSNTAVLSVISWSPSTPTGVTPSFSPTSITASSTTSTLTMDALTSTVAGTYTFTIEAYVNGGIHPTATETLTIGAVGKITPTLSVTNSPVTYNGSSQAATVTPSVAGTVSDIQYDSSSTIPTNAATYAVTADFVTDDTTNYESLADASAGNFTIEQATPTLSVTNSPVTYNGSSQAATVTPSVAGTVSDIQYDSSSTIPTNAATYAVTADFVSDDTTNYESLADASAGNFTIEQATLTVTADNKTSQYSDPLEILTYAITGFVEGEDEDDIDGDPILSVALSDPVTEIPDDYDIVVAIGTLTSTNYSFTLVNGTYTVAKEDATMEFTENPVAVKVWADDQGNETFTIVVAITEAADGYLGDLGKITAADIEISFKPVGGGGGYDQPADSFDPVTREATFNIPQDALDVETYSVEVTLDNDWFVANPIDDVLVVYDPSLGFTTGGGWFYWPEDDSDMAGAKTNFGFNMKYNNKATNIQGSLLLIAHLEDGNYRIKSNTLYGLAIGAEGINGDNYGWASFSGKSTYRWPDGGEVGNKGNQEFMVYVEDLQKPGRNHDQFWFTVLFSSDIPDQSFTLDLDGEKDADEIEIQVIDGGNIVVPHTPSSSNGGGDDSGGGDASSPGGGNGKNK